jgi:hypothetical protein
LTRAVNGWQPDNFDYVTILVSGWREPNGY